MHERQATTQERREIAQQLRARGKDGLVALFLAGKTTFERDGLRLSCSAQPEAIAAPLIYGTPVERAASTAAPRAIPVERHTEPDLTLVSDATTTRDAGDEPDLTKPERCHT